MSIQKKNYKNISLEDTINHIEEDDHPTNIEGDAKKMNNQL